MCTVGGRGACVCVCVEQLVLGEGYPEICLSRVGQAAERYIWMGGLSE